MLSVDPFTKHTSQRITYVSGHFHKLQSYDITKSITNCGSHCIYPLMHSCLWMGHCDTYLQTYKCVSLLWFLCGFTHVHPETVISSENIGHNLIMYVYQAYVSWSYRHQVWLQCQCKLQKSGKAPQLLPQAVCHIHCYGCNCWLC